MQITILFMKRITIIPILLLSGFIGQAQTASQFKHVAAPPRVYASATPSSYETNLTQGKIILSKTFKKGDTEDFETIYTLINNAGRSVDNRKPIRVAMNQRSFDSVFTRVSAEMSDKWPVLNKYITENKLSMADEKGWISVINYYNSLQ